VQKWKKKKNDHHDSHSVSPNPGGNPSLEKAAKSTESSSLLLHFLVTYVIHDPSSPNHARYDRLRWGGEKRDRRDEKNRSDATSKVREEEKLVECGRKERGNEYRKKLINGGFNSLLLLHFFSFFFFSEEIFFGVPHCWQACSNCGRFFLLWDVVCSYVTHILEAKARWTLTWLVLHPMSPFLVMVLAHVLFLCVCVAATAGAFAALKYRRDVPALESGQLGRNYSDA
jgi:hypothetical protein